MTVDAVLADATADVAEAVSWLLAEGARVTNAVATHGMGFAALEFVLEGTEVRIARDRGQWMLDLRLEGQPWLQLDLVHAARTGRSSWEEHSDTGPRPEQLPIGLSWRRELPAALAWVRSTDDAAQQAKAMGRERMAKLFPQR